MWTFHPILKTTIWGGEKIAKYAGISTSLHNIGEDWILSDVEGSESVVDEGPDQGKKLSQLMRHYGPELLGDCNYKRFGHHFPLLIKIIDAAQDLSVQVHPDDELARKRGYSNGKTEMWYVIGADKDARLANGFLKPVDPSKYEELVESGEIVDVMNFNTIHPGEAYFIPAGRVHAIGKGAFVAEIQQTSDVTYRLYDYHRKDKDGKERELHTALAFDAINFNDTDGKAVEFTPIDNFPVQMVDSPYFTTDLLKLSGKTTRDYSELDSFVVLIGIEGTASVKSGNQTVELTPGRAVLLASTETKITLTPKGNVTMLETYIKS